MGRHPQIFPERERLYQSGLTDWGISMATGDKYETIKGWRQRRGYSPNGARKYRKQDRPHNQVSLRLALPAERVSDMLRFLAYVSRAQPGQVSNVMKACRGMMV